MIEKHIVNIGLPKTGTTWLWAHGLFTPYFDKENTILTDELDFDRYVKYYSRFRDSANFQTNLWCVDREIIKFVQQHATHITMIVRNPYSFIESYFDWIHVDQSADQLTNFIVDSGFVQYRDIVERWHTNDHRFKIFFFDDLEQDPFDFFQDYMQFCQMPVVKNNNINYNTKINPNRREQKTKLKFTDQQVNFINQEIDRFQSVVDRDLTHWKK